MAKVNRPNSEQAYRTPPELLAAVERKFGKITFDLACTSENAVAENGFCVDQGVDALAENWASALTPDDVGWCNPEWRNVKPYAERAATSGRRILLNSHLAPDSQWYWRHVHNHARVFVLWPRVPYNKPDGSPAWVQAKTGKPAGINRPVMVAAYGFGLEPGLEMWSWKE